MNLSDDHCKTESNSIVQRKENGKIFRLVNSGKRPIVVCRVDEGLINDGTKRCDFLFVIDAKNKEKLYLVELKGIDHVKAVRQIIDAAETLGIAEFTGEKHSAIVGSPAPKAATTFQNELQRQFSRFKAVGLRLPIRKNDLLAIDV